MIKLILCGLWVCVVTLASMYAMIAWRTAPDPEVAKEQYFGGLEHVRTRTISVPLIDKGVIQGYVTAQFSFNIDAKTLHQLSVKPDVLLLDAAFKTIYAGDILDFRHPGKQDLSLLTKTIADSVNKRFGKRFVEDVLVEELNYVPKDQVRGGNRKPEGMGG